MVLQEDFKAYKMDGPRSDDKCKKELIEKKFLYFKKAKLK